MLSLYFKTDGTGIFRRFRRNPPLKPYFKTSFDFRGGFRTNFHGILLRFFLSTLKTTEPKFSVEINGTFRRKVPLPKSTELFEPLSLISVLNQLFFEKKATNEILL